jgi:hypothetical protein
MGEVFFFNKPEESWINYRYKFFSNLFIRDLNCINKVLKIKDFGLKNTLLIPSFFSFDLAPILKRKI